MSLEGCANSRGTLSLPGGRGIDAAEARAEVMHLITPEEKSVCFGHGA